jgi:hypothetical protein
MRVKKTEKTWRVLVGSKRELRRRLTGQIIQGEIENLKDDLLYGAQAVSKFTGLTFRQVYHQKGALGLRALGDAAA